MRVSAALCRHGGPTVCGQRRVGLSVSSPCRARLNAPPTARVKPTTATHVPALSRPVAEQDDPDDALARSSRRRPVGQSPASRCRAAARSSTSACDHAGDPQRVGRRVRRAASPTSCRCCRCSGRPAASEPRPPSRRTTARRWHPALRRSSAPLSLPDGIASTRKGERRDQHAPVLAADTSTCAILGCRAADQDEPEPPPRPGRSCPPDSRIRSTIAPSTAVTASELAMIDCTANSGSVRTAASDKQEAEPVQRRARAGSATT